jgi:hypothetical protein
MPEEGLVALIRPYPDGRGKMIYILPKDVEHAKSAGCVDPKEFTGEVVNNEEH